MRCGYDIFPYPKYDSNSESWDAQSENELVWAHFWKQKALQYVQYVLPERERERDLLHWYLTVANCPTRTVHCFINEPELHERHSWCAPVLITSLLEFYCCCCCAKSRNQERTKVISGRSSFILFLVSNIYHRPKSESISPDCAGSTKVHHTQHQQ